MVSNLLCENTPNVRLKEEYNKGITDSESGLSECFHLWDEKNNKARFL